MTIPVPVVRTREEIDAALKVLEALNIGDRLDRLERRVDRVRDRQKTRLTPTQARLERLEERVQELEEEVGEDPPGGTLSPGTAQGGGRK